MEPAVFKGPVVSRDLRRTRYSCATGTVPRLLAAISRIGRHHTLCCAHPHVHFMPTQPSMVRFGSNSNKPARVARAICSTCGFGVTTRLPRWTVDALGAPHVGERSEKELIASFVDKVGAARPPVARAECVLTSSAPDRLMRLDVCCRRAVAFAHRSLSSFQLFVNNDHPCFALLRRGVTRRVTA
jgi:hypothetical protein